MATNGPVIIQGCAYRVCRLNADGSVAVSSVGMIQDDRPLVKLELKPNIDEGVEITPKSACGVPVISYKDCNRYKRWDVSLTLGDWDPEQMELVGQGQTIVAPGSSGRTFADGAITTNENIITSPADAAFVSTDVGRTVVDAGFTVAACTTTSASADVTTTNSFTAVDVAPGMPVSGAGIAAGTVVLAVNSATDLTLSQPATAGATVTLTFHRLPLNAYIGEVVSATEARMGGLNIALGTGSALSITLGAQPIETIGYGFPHLLLVPCPLGISIEVWSKLIVRGTGYQGTTPYPSAGTPEIPGSPYLRTGVFRAYQWHDAFSIENKEQESMFTGWAIENPNFGTGPVDDWRDTALPGEGIPIDTTVPIAQLADFELPSPLQPGYQATT